MTDTVNEEGAVRVPVLAVVGRPNVGKSTLVNRILGRRVAVVQDVPGVTRDRVSYDAEWNGREFTVVDTGGWDPDATGLAERIAAQAEVAVSAADAVMFVVDATVGITDADEEVVKVLRRSGKPVVLVANKVDDERGELEAAVLWNLGLGEPFPVSALHGRGAGDLLDVILEVLPEAPRETDDEDEGPHRVALVGKPNAGKSSLLNKLAGSERVVVDSVAGTTVDPVDELVELGERSGGSSTPPASASASRRRRGTSTTRASVRPPRSSVPRSPSSSWTPAHRSPSRTCGSSGRSRRRVAPSSSPSTSGTSSTTSVATTSTARSPVSSSRCSGRRGSTSRR